MRELTDVHYPDAESIRAVQDNLSTHSAGVLYEAFAPAEARRILRRLEFHYTPKHASWLNMVEIGVLRGQCLDRRIDDPKRLISEIAAWKRQRNAAGARIKWMFTTDKARAKMGRAYPVTLRRNLQHRVLRQARGGCSPDESQFHGQDRGPVGGAGGGSQHGSRGIDGDPSRKRREKR